MELTDSAAGLPGATLLTLATGLLGHSFSVVVAVEVLPALVPFSPFVSPFIGWSPFSGAALLPPAGEKAASSAEDSRSVTVLRSVASLAKALRACLIEYYDEHASSTADH